MSIKSLGRGLKEWVDLEIGKISGSQGYRAIAQTVCIAYIDTGPSKKAGPSVNFMVEPNIPKRLKVLETSLLVEHLTSKMLASMIDVKDLYASKTLGNKSTALSFSQKVNLLIDIGALDEAKRAKFQRFMEIRNQFMHNIDANSYVACASFIEGLQKYLLKTYETDTKVDIEEQLEIAISQLCSEVVYDTVGILHHVMNKHLTEGHSEGTQISNKAMIDSIADLVQNLDENPTLINTANGNIGTQIHELFMQLFEKHTGRSYPM